MRSLLRHLLSFILPIIVLVVVPAIIQPFVIPGNAWFVPGLVIMAAGLVIMAVNIWMFAAVGRGTLAPWDPPSELVVRGLYAHVRNPMILGVLVTLAGEAVALRSWRLAVWAAAFFAGNTAYFIFFEEPSLEKRFGPSYVEYKRNVRRWLPRAKAWLPDASRDGGTDGL